MLNPKAYGLYDKFSEEELSELLMTAYTMLGNRLITTKLDCSGCAAESIIKYGKNIANSISCTKAMDMLSFRQHNYYIQFALTKRDVGDPSVIPCKDILWNMLRNNLDSLTRRLFI